MTKYLVSYDLSRPGQDYSKLIEHMKSYGTWAHPLKSVWVIVTTKTAVAVRNDASAYLDANDKILVVELGHPAAWRGLSDELTQWLKNNL
ncbi:hypothetical protein ELQ90_03055 [Labedella phragmitis]|uniref:SinR family protein n=1 Tax=Labedella phragmitis TaxID=2498849 RepID=A0A3S4A716_9MICO|nr:hypothetical protein [Labedella phragmitis]RWZ52928.1 hypothetical protein ELQ90_03055 [Labedella phragmitis]